MSTTRDATCEERIASHRESRLADFRDLLAITREEQPSQSYDELGVDDENAAESAQERIWEYPLGVSSYTTYRVDISMGGPADWLEVVMSDDEIDRIVYHFADWFDHAEDTLNGEDFETAADFARSVIPDLA